MEDFHVAAVSFFFLGGFRGFFSFLRFSLRRAQARERVLSERVPRTHPPTTLPF